MGATLTGSLDLGWRQGGLTGRGPWGRPGSSPSGLGLLLPSLSVASLGANGDGGFRVPRRPHV